MQWERFAVVTMLGLGACADGDPVGVADVEVGHASLEDCNGTVVSNDGVLVCETDDVVRYDDYKANCADCDEPPPVPHIAYDAVKKACVDAAGNPTSQRNRAKCNFADGSCECTDFTFVWQIDEKQQEARGAVFSDLDFAQVQFRAPGANFERAVFSNARLVGADLRGANLRDADLRGANLTAAKLSGADLTGANLTSAVLKLVDLERAKLDGAILLEATLQPQYSPPTQQSPEATLQQHGLSHLVSMKNAVLSDAVLQSGDFRFFDLSGAVLRGANAHSANLRGASLLGADLTGTDLRHAILKDANLKGNFRFANLCQADLSGALLPASPFPGTFYDAGTLWPSPLAPQQAYASLGLLLLAANQCAALPLPVGAPANEQPRALSMGAGGYINPVELKLLEYRGLVVDVTHPDHKPNVAWTPGEAWREGESWDMTRDDKARVFKNRVFVMRPKPGSNHQFVGVKVYKRRIPLGDGAWEPLYPPSKWPCEGSFGSNNCLESRDFVYKLVRAVSPTSLPSTLWDLYVADPARLSGYQAGEAALTMALHLVPFGASALSAFDHGFWSQQFGVNLAADIGTALSFGASKTLKLGKDGILGVTSVSLGNQAVKPVILAGYALQGPQLVLEGRQVVQEGDLGGAALITLRIVGITESIKNGLAVKTPRPITVKFDEVVPPNYIPNNRGWVALLAPDDVVRPHIFPTSRVPGFFDLHAHGTHDALWAKVADDNWKKLSTKNVAALLTHHPQFQLKGCVGLRLMACSAGQDERCALGGLFKLQNAKRTVAEELAILTGKPVVAPVETLWSEIGKNNFTQWTVHRRRNQNDLARGWKIFTPVKDDAGKVVRVDIKWFDWQGNAAP